ncbi:processed acidic surface protein [Bacillus taeanensis]|uniref:Processed acidic surface protein n=1 Tax=Bacillus taeanensis TaxID=273032 RepID=A0A366XXQ8_9BACI|nr:processed acidic surface protein [Bacillus taeanensis]RBW68913.1 processed acidic surface protein [Bacillus taeanensis]
MKKILASVLAAVMMVTIFPATMFAAVDQTELTAYLTEITMTEEELVEYLAFYDYPLEDFESVEELRDFLGPVVTEETLNELLQNYELTKEELIALLVEYGELEEGEEIADAFKFISDLDSAVYFYLEEQNYTPITDESLQQLLDEYGLTKEELEALLNEYEDSLEYYEYIEELEYALDFYMNYDGELPDMSEFFTEFGLTEEELDALFTHFAEVIEGNEEAFLDQMLALNDRMMKFENFDSATELSAADIAELLSIYHEVLQLSQLKVKFYLVKDGKKEPLSLEALMKIDYLDGADLLIELYNLQGEFLADLVLTAEMFDSELLKETGEDLAETVKVVEEVKEAKEAPKQANKKPLQKTVKGGKLPDTASDYVQNMLIGLLLIASGVFLYRKLKVKGA